MIRNTSVATSEPNAETINSAAGKHPPSSFASDCLLTVGFPLTVWRNDVSRVILMFDGILVLFGFGE